MWFFEGGRLVCLTSSFSFFILVYVYGLMFLCYWSVFGF